VTGGTGVVRVDRGVGRRVGVRRADGDALADAEGLGATVGLGDADGLGAGDGEEDTDGRAEPGEPYASTPIPPATAKYTPTTAAAKTRARPVATVARRRRSSAS
jgi:hypothetical protein